LAHQLNVQGRQQQMKKLLEVAEGESLKIGEELMIG